MYMYMFASMYSVLYYIHNVIYVYIICMYTHTYPMCIHICVHMSSLYTHILYIYVYIYEITHMYMYVYRHSYTIDDTYACNRQHWVVAERDPEALELPPAPGGGDRLGWGHTGILYKAPTDCTKPQSIIQSPNKLYKDPKKIIQSLQKIHKDITY